MRKLASIRQISEILPIPDADAIECATVDGWSVVIKKNEFHAGDCVVYCEIDSWIPHDLAPFLSKGKEPREYEGVKGERLRTVRLRGQLSQGLILPFTASMAISMGAGPDAQFTDYLGKDVSELLNIKKWEAPIPAQLGGKVYGSFPSHIAKTDQERIQNLTSEYKDWQGQNLTWEVTEKLDGSSMTVFLDEEGHFGVCSRNWELEETDDNSLWRAARVLNIEHQLRELNLCIAIQGELIGEGIQGNPYKLKGQQFWVFDVLDSKGHKMDPVAARAVVKQLGLTSVPLIGYETLTKSVVEQLEAAEGKSVLCATTEREGLVFKCLERPGLSFKAISNAFLLKSK